MNKTVLTKQFSSYDDTFFKCDSNDPYKAQLFTKRPRHRMGKPHEVSKRVFLSADVHVGHVTAPLSSRRVLRAAAGVGEGRLIGFLQLF